MTLSVLTPASYTRNSAAMWALIAALVSSGGFTLLRGSDGVSTYVDATPSVSGGGTGAGGFDNPRAWVVLRDPNGNRELCIQRDASAAGTTGVSFRLKYSAGGFGSTGATATVVPDNGTGQIICGGGSDASPSFSNFLGSTANVFKLGASIDADGMGGPAGFRAWTIPNGGGTPVMFLALEPMADGSYSPTDPDPVVIVASGSGAGYLSFQATATGQPWARAWLRKGLSGEGFVTVGLMNLSDGSTTVVPNTGGEDHMVGGQIGVPCTWIRRSSLAAPAGLKGVSQFLRMKTATVNSGQQTATDGVHVDGVVIGDFIVPWTDTAFPL